MSHVWVHDGDGAWSVFALEGPAYAVEGGWPRPLAASGELGSPAAVLTRSGDARQAWLVISSVDDAVRVNGATLKTGIRVLADRDEIYVRGAGTLYFSTEDLAQVQPLPELGKKLFCPRCKLPLDPGTPAVRCPAATCRVWHHQNGELDCWTYAEKCAVCDQPTPLDAGHRWTPEVIGA